MGRDPANGGNDPVRFFFWAEKASFGENIRMARLVGRLAPLQPACAELRRLSVVVAGRRDNGIVTRFLVALLLTKQCRLAVFWCPEVGSLIPNLA